MEIKNCASFLRTLADFYELHPDTPAPSIWGWSNDVSIYLPAEKSKEYLRRIGAFEKEYVGETFRAKKILNDGEVVLLFNTDRTAVCRKVVKGTRVVPETYVPGTEGHIEPEHEEEIVEWECDEPILAETEQEFSVGTPGGDIPF